MSRMILVKSTGEGNEAFVDDSSAQHVGYDTFNNPGVEELELSNLKQDEDEDEEFEYNLIRSLPSRKSRTRHGTPESILKSRGRVRPQDQGYEVVDGGEVPMQDLPVRRASAKEAMKSVDSLRRMTIPMDEKKKVKLREKPARGKKERPISTWMEFKFSTSMKVRRQFQNIKQALSSFHIWQDHMKRIQGMFGTGVLSYFVFLRWLVYVNIFICILLVCFLVIPQSIHSTSYINNPQNFTGLELLTGEGWFTHTELYYGRYTNETINGKYHMQMAYLLVGSGHILICLAILVVSIGKSYKENYIIGGESFTRFCSKVFCAWDYSISNRDTALLKEQSIYRDILETVGPEKVESDKPVLVKCQLVFIRVATWILSLAITALSVWLIVYVSQETVEGIISNPETQSAKGMLPAITISLVNIIIPPVFRMIALLEKYASRETTVNVNLFRTIVLQLASICVYVVHLYLEVKREREEGVIEMNHICWETFVGQVFYKLVIIDFIATLLSTFLNEFLRNIFSKYCCRDYKPGFDISKNVLNLIYGQGIVWVGSFFSPLLPVINIIKLVVVFYVKRLSVTRNCKPSVKPFKASRMHVLFRLLLSLMLIFTCVVIGVVVLNDGQLKPSLACGPFRNESKIYNVVPKTLEHHIPSWFKTIVELISSWVVIGALAFIMFLLAYYFRLKKNTTEKKIEGLKYQLTLASQDKQFLIRQIKTLCKSQVGEQHSNQHTPAKEKIP